MTSKNPRPIARVGPLVATAIAGAAALIGYRTGMADIALRWAYSRLGF